MNSIFLKYFIEDCHLQAYSNFLIIVWNAVGLSLRQGMLMSYQDQNFENYHPDVVTTFENLYKIQGNIQLNRETISNLFQGGKKGKVIHRGNITIISYKDLKNNEERLNYVRRNFPLLANIDLFPEKSMNLYYGYKDSQQQIQCNNIYGWEK